MWKLNVEYKYILQDTSAGVQIKTDIFQNLQSLENVILKRCEEAFYEGFRQGCEHMQHSMHTIAVMHTCSLNRCVK